MESIPSPNIDPIIERGCLEKDTNFILMINVHLCLYKGFEKEGGGTSALISSFSRMCRPQPQSCRDRFHY